MRHEHTLTALWDREAWEAGRVRARGGYRPSGQRSQGDDRMGTVAMETQAAQANRGNW